MISEELLLKYNGRKNFYSKGSYLFHEHRQALHYFQVATGEVKMCNYNDEGREFIQGIFTESDSFGEPPLLNGKLYLTNAIALTDSEVWMVSKENFVKMLSENTSAAMAICTRLSNRLYYKSIMAMELSSEVAEHRLLRFFDFLKLDVANLEKDDSYAVNLTRQQLADLTGLRVETVIRSVKSLEKKNLITIKERKIYR